MSKGLEIFVIFIVAIVLNVIWVIFNFLSAFALDNPNSNPIFAYSLFALLNLVPLVLIIFFLYKIRKAHPYLIIPLLVLFFIVAIKMRIIAMYQTILFFS